MLQNPIPLSCIQMAKTVCSGVGDISCHSSDAFDQGPLLSSSIGLLGLLNSVG